MLFQNGFEEGDFSAWTGNTTGSGATLSVVSDKKRTGTYSGHFYTPGGSWATIYKTLASTYSTIYIGERVWLDNLPATDQSITMMGAFSGTPADATTVAVAGLFNPSGTPVWSVKWRNGANLVRENSSRKATTGAWHFIVMKVVVHGTNGEVKLWVDNDLVIDLTGKDTDALGNISRVSAEAGTWGYTSAAEGWVDDFMVSEVPFSSVDSRSVKIKGKASSDGSRGAKITGKLNKDDTRGARIYGVTTPSWYNSSWLRRVKVTILASKVDGDLTDYPVYVDLSKLPSDFHTYCNQTDARDIRVTKQDGVTELPREVVFYDSATDTGELHFKYTGVLSKLTDTDVYIYYKNPSASDYAVTDTYGRNNVWNSNYKMVQHMRNTTTSTITDSTSNGNNGTKKAANEPIEASGKIAKAQSFDGSNDYVNCGNGASLNITSAITIEAWIKPGGYRPYAGVIDKIQWGSGGYTLRLREDNHKMSFDFITQSGRGELLSISNIELNQWYHIIGSYDGSQSRIYINGQLNNNSNRTGNIVSTTQDLYIGWDDSESTRYFNGLIDEIRISSSAHSSDWISTEYNNQNDVSSFFTIGTAELNQIQTNSERSAKTTGKQGINAERGTKITGKATTNDSRGAKITGKSSASGSRDAKITGEVTAVNGARSCHITGKNVSASGCSMHITGKDAIYGNRNAKILGKQNISNTRSAKIGGIQSTNSERNAKIIGESTASGTVSVKLLGKSYANDDANAKLSGTAHTTNEISARITGKLTETSECNAKLLGIAVATGTCGARITGGASTNGERGAKLTGESITRSERLGKLLGNALSSSECNFKIIGKLATNTECNLEITGKQTTLAECNLEITGKLAKDAYRNVSIQGKDTRDSVINASIRGKVTVFSALLARLTGSFRKHDEITARLKGEDTASVSQTAKITGKLCASDIVSAKLQGTQGVTDQCSVRIVGRGIWYRHIPRPFKVRCTKSIGTKNTKIWRKHLD